jgi:hypothetical protein
MFRIASLAIAAAFAAAPAFAVTNLSDDFASYGTNTQTNAPNSLFGGVWQTVDGTVDYLVKGKNFGGLCNGDTACIDLDGSTNNSGVFQTASIFDQGRYAYNFKLFGSGRGGSETVAISFGDVNLSKTLASAETWIVSGFANVGAGGARLSFSTPSNDNVGPILTSVAVNAVPLPAAAPMLIGALSLVGALRLRRRQG